MCRCVYIIACWKCLEKVIGKEIVREECGVLCARMVKVMMVVRVMEKKLEVEYERRCNL